MSVSEQFITIFLCGFATFVTRFLPFVIFSNNKQTPKIIVYLGKTLPIALFVMLVVYCLKDMTFSEVDNYVSQIIAIIVTVALRLLFKKNLISIIGGSATYIFLVNLVFVA